MEDGWMDDGWMSIQKIDEGMDDGRIVVLMDGWIMDIDMDGWMMDG